MMMPYMPRAMCCTIGLAPQWYMNTPGTLATNLKCLLSPGLTGANSSSTLTCAAWKSIACEFLFDAGLTSVKSTVSPSFTRTGLPGMLPSNVHAAMVSAPPTKAPLVWTSTSIAVIVTLTVFANTCCAEQSAATAIKARVAFLNVCMVIPSLMIVNYELPLCHCAASCCCFQVPNLHLHNMRKCCTRSLISSSLSAPSQGGIRTDLLIEDPPSLMTLNSDSSERVDIAFASVWSRGCTDMSRTFMPLPLPCMPWHCTQ